MLPPNHNPHRSTSQPVAKEQEQEPLPEHKPKPLPPAHKTDIFHKLESGEPRANYLDTPSGSLLKTYQHDYDYLAQATQTLHLEGLERRDYLKSLAAEPTNDLGVVPLNLLDLIHAFDMLKPRDMAYIPAFMDTTHKPKQMPDDTAYLRPYGMYSKDPTIMLDTGSAEPAPDLKPQMLIACFLMTPARAWRLPKGIKAQLIDNYCRTNQGLELYKDRGISYYLIKTGPTAVQQNLSPIV